MRIVLTLLLIILPTIGYGATQTASTCSYANVLSAYNAASSGDTVAIPSGTCDWGGSSLDVAKTNITFEGAGTSNTFISGNIIFEFNGSSSNGARVTGIYFDSAYIHFSGPTKDWRIDHNYFNDQYIAIQTNAVVRGLIDNNTFDHSYAIYMFFDGNSTVTYPFDVGDQITESTDILFIEDNLFTGMTNITCQPHTWVGNLAARAVIRYNVIDYRPSTCWDALDAHDSYENWPSRGTLGYEIYKNKFYHAPGAARTIHLRGGQHMVWSNYFFESMNNAIRITSYTYQSAPARCDGNEWDTDDSDPDSCPDQINHSWFWDNKDNCDDDMDTCVGGSNEAVQNLVPEVIFEDTHFYRAESVAYNPYIYPHPLRDEDPPPTVSQGLIKGGTLKGGSIQ